MPSHPPEAWEWKDAADDLDLKRAPFATLPVGRLLVGTGRAIAIAASHLSPSADELCAFDETSLEVFARIPMPCKTPRPFEAQWVVGLTVDPRTQDERTAVVSLLLADRPVARWKTLWRGLDHNGSFALIDGEALRWLEATERDAWERELHEQSTNHDWKWAAGGPVSGGTFVRTSAGYGDGAATVHVGEDEDGTCVCVVVDFEMNLALLHDIAADSTENRADAGEPIAQALAALDRRWLACSDVVDVPTDVKAAHLADLGRTQSDPSFGVDSLAYLERGGSIEPFVARVRAMRNALDFTLQHWGRDLRRALIATLPPTHALLWFRLGTLLDTVGDRPRGPWTRDALPWVTALLEAGDGGQRYPADSPLKADAHWPSALHFETVLVALGYPSETLLRGALEAELDDRWTPQKLASLPDAAAYVERHPSLVEATSRSKVVRRLLLLVETLRFAGVNPSIAGGLAKRLAKNRRGTKVAQRARAWEASYGLPLPYRFDPDPDPDFGF